MLNLAELALLTLAAARGTQLIVHDTILDPARDQIFAWKAQRPHGKTRDFVVTLISCVYCTGFWLSGAALGMWLLGTGQWSSAPPLIHGVEWFAVAGGQALLNRADDTMGSTQ